MSSPAAARRPPGNPIVLIPARMDSRRLPGKPLETIAGRPMIVHVLERAEAAGIGPVVVACAEHAIAEAVKGAGGRAVLTRPDHPSGSDRICEALKAIDPAEQHDAVVNLQGDQPTIDPSLLERALALLADPDVDVGTLAAEIANPAERADTNVVKAVVSYQPGSAQGRALYFTRATAPTGEGPLWYHIGLYAYRREALARFVALPPSPLERRERLEQLRVLEDGMRIEVAFVDTVPLGVDTPAQLERARALIAGNRK